MSPDWNSPATTSLTVSNGLVQVTPLEAAGAAANQAAARGVFVDYLSRKSDYTIRNHAAGLQRFGQFLTAVLPALELGTPVQALAAAVAAFPRTGALDGSLWPKGITWGLVEGFRNWMIGQGEAVATINLRLSSLKTFCGLAVKGDLLSTDEHSKIRLVNGYSRKEAVKLNERRPKSRRSAKKAQHVSISDRQAEALKRLPDVSTGQGRRDALIMALLLDMGLRVSEVAGLRVTDFDLEKRTLTFYRPKVSLTQTHDLPLDVYQAAKTYFDSGDAPAAGLVLRGSLKDGRLNGLGMSERAIGIRVRELGEAVGLESLSPHDCRHYWATYWAKRVHKLPRGVFSFQEAGGWASLTMPRRYVEQAQIANEGMA